MDGEESQRGGWKIGRGGEWKGGVIWMKGEGERSCFSLSA